MQLGKYETRLGRIVDIMQRYEVRIERDAKVVEVTRYKGQLLKTNGHVETVLTYEDEPSGKPIAREIPPPGQRQTSAGDRDLIRMIRADEIQPVQRTLLTIEAVMSTCGAEFADGATEAFESGMTPEDFALAVIRKMAASLAGRGQQHLKRKAG